MTHYEAGVRAERKAMRDLEEMGFITLRTAGSHGVIDVIAIDPNGKEVRFVQVKVVSGDPRSFAPELDDLAKTFPASRKWKVSGWLYQWKKGGSQWARQEVAD